MIPHIAYHRYHYVINHSVSQNTGSGSNVIDRAEPNVVLTANIIRRSFPEDVSQGQRTGVQGFVLKYFPSW